MNYTYLHIYILVIHNLYLFQTLSR